MTCAKASFSAFGRDLLLTAWQRLPRHGLIRLLGVLNAAPRRSHRFFPPTKGMVAACFIHDANWRSSKSSIDANSTPRVDLPIPIGVTGGSGLISVPRMNISFTWPTKAPEEKHQPPSTPKYAIPHFTARWMFGKHLAAR